MRNNVTLRQIEGFLQAGELLSFSRAAEAMHITQSAFSQLVRELEAALGVRLFDRTTRRVALTDAGVILHAKMKRGVVEIDDAAKRLAPLPAWSMATLPSAPWDRSRSGS